MKMKTLKILTFCLLTVVIVLAGCSKSDNTKKSDVLSQQIHNIVPDSIITKMKNLGMQINGGTTPPDLQHIYYVDPFVLKSSNISYDYPGKLFASYLVQFYAQDNTALSIKLNYINGNETGTGLGGFISGSDNSFSVFAKVRAEIDGDSAYVIEVLSGTIVTGAIKNFYYANFMLDNYGNPDGVFIEQGEGRIIYDSDGTSEEQSSFTSPGKKKSAILLKSVSSK
jgi:hypothetical protein